ncbi:hypothetical protein ACFO5R_14675 [Halosolutus amylolyticus]|uniref:Halobacterial output domain-containing protein n=1 Tax=Halosolutus amylolyticus TaxID=2932267 RepID=A0ABD5PRS9_9EURY|nr:hypothetical protein [Halosolutus amylolyticus]
MALITDGTDDRGTYEELVTHDRDRHEPDRRRRIDVTDLHAAGIDSFVRSNVETDRVSLEHRGARTYLVIEE